MAFHRWQLGLLIRNESRTIYEIVRRIRQKSYVMDPEFQREFIWPEDKQSKLIESVIMRIPLPVFYLAEDDEGRMVVVDGLQRLSTFSRLIGGELKLNLPGREELDGRTFSDEPLAELRIGEGFSVSVSSMRQARVGLIGWTLGPLSDSV